MTRSEAGPVALDAWGQTPSRTNLPEAERLGLPTLPLPVQMPAIPLHLVWHQRYDNGHAHPWLHEQAAQTVQALFHR
ncbi:hypothetical protein [Streptomyces sp. NPDC088115]|uniref:hypothetical protein n=1 Tax=Streptomyces sp. NPDC088115 TaxID=3365824 RepID=UPI00382895FB